MDVVKKPNRRRQCRARRGMAPIESVMALGIVFPMAVVLYMIAQKSLCNLYHVVAHLVGYPYL